ncbi:MAG: CTP-dependent riboflavin kinase [Candidatus Bathyarchaeota archaeon]|nr:CTP-dependent riboflavin kinase [Candidatus Bathyarchaeota archaeon]
MISEVVDNRRMKPLYLLALIKLTELGAHRKFIEISTRRLGSILGLSQQSASRLLRRLEEEKLIERDKSFKSSRVKVTMEGFVPIIDLYNMLKNILEKPTILVFRGTVFSGLGEGAYYVKVYSKFFLEKLGFIPYPGTLNVKLKSLDDIKIARSILMLPGINIKGFSNDSRSYGDVKCYKAYLRGEEVYIVFPERTHYGADVIEIISAENIREKLKLRDGDIVDVEVPVS